MINNVDTDWGNGSKRVSKLARCRLGRLETQSIKTVVITTGAEARLVNNATYNAGIACVIAAGNDGKQRIASPGSADGAITIGSADNADTINRTDDFMASYSILGLD